MIRLINKLILFASLLVCVSCNYLDIVPDEKATEEDAFKNPKAAERFLYSCYSYMPNVRDGQNSMDLFTGDDIVTHWEHESFAKFAQGNYTPSNPVINYWDRLYKGIRQCYLLKANIGSVPGLSDELKNDYMAEADFLIGYYHFFLIRNYGPVVIVDRLFEAEELGDPESSLARSPYDQCVEWITGLLYSAYERLPVKRTGTEYGRATKAIALSIRARLLLYAASPQFNGGEKFVSMYSNFKNEDGTQLISTTYDPNKWTKAKDACKLAIDVADAAGHELYYAKPGALAQAPEPTDLTQRNLRFTFIDKDNSTEVIWGYCQKEGGNTQLQGKSVPRWNQYCWGGLGITLRQVQRFYTERGLPIDEDPDFNSNYYGVTTIPAGYPNAKPGERTLEMNLHREPRFYAWVAFHNGYFEVFGEDKSSSATFSYATRYKCGINNAKQVIQFTRGSNNGQNDKGEQGTKSGYLNKKGANPATNVTTDGLKIAEYPWPLVRLGELYLNYAEACVECNDLPEAKKYLNFIRKRAGIPDVDTSWGYVNIVPDQNKMREIVRRERQIELYLENHNFWDLRRWGIAEVLGEAPMGLSVWEKDIEAFANPSPTNVSRRFIPAQYLMPIPISEINKTPKLVQNPGYVSIDDATDDTEE